MDIDQVVGEICKSGLEAELSVERKDDGESYWTFEIVAAGGRYELAPNVEKHDTSRKTPFDHDYHQKMLKIGSIVYEPAEGEKDDAFVWKSRAEQLKSLMEYIGVQDGSFVVGSRDMVHMYHDVAKVVSALIGQGCTVRFAGSEEKAQKLAELTDA